VEFIIGRKKPKPGESGEALEIQGAGTYEIVLNVPEWIPGGDYESNKSFRFPIPGWEIEHKRTYYNRADSSLVIRVRVHEKPETAGTAAGDQIEGFPFVALTAGNIIRGVAAILGGWLVTKLLSIIVDAIREIRKILEISPVIVWTVAGVALLLTVRGVSRATAT